MELTERLLEALADRFINRWDTYAVQTERNDYQSVQGSISPQLIRDHLEGRVTLAVPALAQDKTARWALLDHDGDEGLSDLQGLWAELHQLGVPSYLEASRRGGHLWIFYSPMAAQAVFYCTHWLLKRVGFKKRVEVFPKQLETGDMAGLIRLPLGVHRLSNQRYGFVDPVTLKPIGGDILEQLEYLETFERVPGFRVAELLAEALAYRSTKKPKGRSEIPTLKERMGTFRTSFHDVSWTEE